MNKQDWILLDMLGYCEAGYRYNVLNDAYLQSKKPYRIEVMQYGNDYGYCSFENDRIVFSFNGSDDKLDWINNFKGLKILNEKIHYGFLLSAQRFYDDIQKFINDAFSKNPKVKIFVTGQSRGGAIALIVSWHISGCIGAPCSCITFGAPMVGGNQFRDEFRALAIHCTEVVNGNDLVTRIPPESLGWEHCGYIYQLPMKVWMLFPWSIKKKHICSGYRAALESYYDRYKVK